MTDFNAQANAANRLPRALAAAAATVCTTLVLASVAGLAGHYQDQAAMQWAAGFTQQPA
jgi:hypothetical protein